MSLQEKSNLVAQLQLKTNTYYITDRDGGILLDGNTYENVVIEWGNVPHIGNLGNGEFEVGSMTVILNNGEEYTGGGYRFDPTDIWNNSTVVVKRYTNGTHFRFEDCLSFTKGIIKEHKISQDQISFTVEAKDSRDDILLPGILCQDQGNLSAFEASTSFKNWGNQDLIEPTDITIFSIGELVKLTAPDGNTEYARVKAKTTAGTGESLLQFYENLQYHSNYVFTFNNTIEKAFRFLPKTFVDKTVPIQIGDLTNTSDGIFAKLLTVSDETGSNAILADYYTLNEFNNLGSWENGLKRYFEAQAVNATVQGNQAEYEIDGNTAKFRVDTTTTLTANITDTVQGISVINVADYTQLMWVDQDDLGTGVSAKLISVNVLAINNELMLLMQKPTSNQVYVERGFNNTTITTHQAGDAVFQSAKYSSKNLLIFTERFMPTAVTNQTESDSRSSTSLFDKSGNEDPNFTNYYVIDSSTGNGKLSNIIDVDLTNWVETYVRIFAGDVVSFDFAYYYLLFDLVFENIENDFDTIAWYPATKYNLSCESNANVQSFSMVIPGLINPDATFFSNVRDYYSNGLASSIFRFGGAGANNGSTTTQENDFYTTINRNDDGDYGGSVETVPSTNQNFWTQSLNAGVGNGDNANSGFSLSKLSDLNKKWRFFIENHLRANSADDGAQNILEAEISNFGFWIDFFIDFSEKVVMGSVKGREYEANLIDVVGNASPDSTGDLIENPVDVLAHLCAIELGYLTDAVVTGQTEFTSNWQTEHDYIEDSTNYEITSPASPVPECAFSYGVSDERKPGWEFISWIASHFNLQIIKTYNGLVDIVNLHKIYNDTPVGNEIKIEDILFLPQNGNRRITVHQTGTDLIYNDIVVKWKRNNSTGDYQETYILPDTYTMVKSGTTLSDARDDFYGGAKRTLTIESPFIYNEQDARRLAEWKADDQAETHFYIDFYIDFMHYSDKNSLSAQYKVGDIIYLDGKHAGITFSSSRKFYIQNVIFGDSGRETQIQAKSLDPVNLF